jgi:predicted GNAT family acetyltransferase
VVGADDTAHWFAEHAVSLGAKLGQPIPQRIHVLSHPPRYPQAAGSARPATADDASLLHAWLSAFRREATPHDPPPSREDAEKAAHSGRFLLWTVDGEPVAMAAVNRSLRHTGAIGAVYTPPEHRGRGYAGSVTAAVADRIPRRRQDQRLPPHGPAQPGVQPLLREDRVRRLLRGPALSAGQLCRLSPERGGLGPSAVPATNR